jgi:cytochrome c oxidase subunit 2
MKANFVNHRLLLAISAFALSTSVIIIPACSPGKTTVTATVTVSQPPISIIPGTGSLANGQNIFLTAVDSAGVHVAAQGFAMMSRGFACADCHGQQGHGGTVYMMMAQYQVPNITWPVLTGADFIPPFTVDTVKRAVTQGLDEKGKALDPFMPRWIMSVQDLSDVVSYLQTLK